MSFDDVLLVLIREFVVLQVDLAFPHHLHLEIHPKSTKSYQFRVDPDPPDDRNLPDVRRPRNHRTSDLTGRPEPLTRAEISGFPTRPDVRRPDIRPFPDVRYL